MTSIPWLNPNTLDFPAPDTALKDPNGLLALGGDLSPERILNAYRLGVFPWFNPGDPILWWSPDPRTVIYPEKLHISRSLQKALRKKIYRVTFDHDFEQVMRHCAGARPKADGTWINQDMLSAYCALHQMGFAHSVEVWREQEGKNELVGGLYGIAIGRVFFGESMFSHANNASKFGFAHLVKQLREWQFVLIDCQVASDHLFTLGATEISRRDFQKILQEFARDPSVRLNQHSWAETDLSEW